MRKVQALIITLLIYKVLSAEKCMEDYILRYNWEQGIKKHNICCRKVPKNCPPGFYVKKCETHLGKDECIPCPGTTWLVDETNSTRVHNCVQYACATGSKRVDYLPKTGCRLPCICDLKWNYYGFDSCNCRLFEGKCPNGTTLTMNGTCLSDIDASKVNDLRPVKDAVHIPIITTPTVNGTINNNTNQVENDTEIHKWIITGVSILGLVVIVIAIWKIYNCKNSKSNQNDLENQNIQSKSSLLPSTVTDSGVSMATSSSASGLPDAATDQHSAKLEQQPLLEQTKVQESTSHEIPIELQDLTQTNLNGELRDKVTNENQTGTMVVKMDLNLNLRDEFHLQKEQQNANKEQNHGSCTGNIDDHVLTEQSHLVRKLVACVPPFSHKNEVVAKETDQLLNSANVQMDPGEIIQHNRPVLDNIPSSQRQQAQEYIDVRYNFGSRLEMTNSLGDMSNV